MIRKDRPPRTPLPPRTGSAQSYVTAEQAVSALGIKRPTLYSYVSRGLIRSIIQPGSRSRLYYREDVERASNRIGGRAGMPDTAEAVLTWGLPIVNTAITALTEDGQIYRGRAARELAESGRSFESVAELLWSGIDMPQLLNWEMPKLPTPFQSRLRAALANAPHLSSMRIMAATTGLLAVDGPRRPDFERGTTIPDSRAMMLAFARAFGFIGPAKQFIGTLADDVSLAEVVLRAFGATVSGRNLRAINAAMIIAADHEMSPSTLAVRVAASCGGELRNCILAAISTHGGDFLAGGCDHSDGLLRKVRNAADLHALMENIERSGGRILGYNLKVYPKGDPRAQFLLSLAPTLGGAADPIIKLVEGVQEKFDLKPSLEIGLIALAVGLGLPKGAASAIWALARVAGWVAHVIEQRQAGFMVRPRALYIGPDPRANG